MSSDIPWPLGNPVEASSTHLPPLVLVDILREQFERARRGAQLRRLWAALHRQSTALPTYTDLLDGLVPQVERPCVTQQVPIAQIVGSEGRSSDFDQAFRPLKRHMRERWLRIALVWMEGAPLPPVHLIQLGDTYLVRDGHHRVSVARAFGATAITAAGPRLPRSGSRRQRRSRRHRPPARPPTPSSRR